MNTRTRKRLRFWIVAALVVVAGGLLAFALTQTARADRIGVHGKAALLRAEQHIRAHNVKAARQDLLEARADFRQMQHDLNGMGPLAPLARVTPFVRIQVRGAKAFADAGELMSDAGLNLVAAADRVLDPKDTHLRIADAVGELRNIQAALNQGIGALNRAADKVRALDGYRLIGPLDRARRDLAQRLPRIGARAVSARDGLDALIDMLGGSGPRRFLVFSQNPDEVRPTGGFIGTYGLLVTRNSHLVLERYDSIENWYTGRPQAEIPANQAALPLALNSPPEPQTIANVNAIADFPTAGKLAAELWRRGGEQPVDGVIAMTPDVMARVLRVLGPVVVPGYGETVNANNLLARVDFHTHLEVSTPQNPNRKAFLIELVHVVVQRLLDAPASRWDPLAQAMARGFETREAMAWSSRPAIEHALSERAWTGALPGVPGDFFYEGDFEYAAKNGRGLRRTFDHNVVLHADGSAEITTKVTIANTLPANDRGLLNIDSQSFVTVYGPAGASLDPASDPPDTAGELLAGHPGASWFASADPLSSTSFTVHWHVPRLATVSSDGALTYQLHFMGVPAHQGDVLHLNVRLPPGWRWNGAAPPKTRPLDQDVLGSWQLVHP